MSHKSGADGAEKKSNDRLKQSWRDGDCGACAAHVHAEESGGRDRVCETCAAHAHGGNAHVHGVSGGKINIIKLVLSASLLVAAILVTHFIASEAGKVVGIVLYAAAFAVVGLEIVLNAVKGLFHRDFFNENTLMTVAAIGAMCLGEYFEGVAVMLLYSLGETLQDAAVEKSRSNISALMDLKQNISKLLTEDGIVSVETDSLKVGDVVLVGTGEKVPVDGVVVSGDGYVDSSVLTGESVPLRVFEGAEVKGGYINKEGALSVRVSKEFKDTGVARILELIEEGSQSKPRAEKFVTKFAAIYTPVVFVCALFAAFVVPAFYGDYTAHLGEWIEKALTFLVIACPCALVISVPLGFMSGIGALSARGALVKGGNYLEALNTVDTVCMDKTGTLSEGVFTVTGVYADDAEATLELAARCEVFSSHPIAKAIAAAAKDGGEKVADCKETAGKGVSCLYGGKAALVGSRALLNDNGVKIVGDDFKGAGSRVYVALDGKYMGCITVGDRLRAEAAETVAVLKARGKRVVILSGDNAAYVEAVGREVDADEAHGGLLPEEKVAYIKKLSAEGRKIAFVGDGLNDAPALKLADVGICIGGIGNDASVEAGDIVLTGCGIKALPEAFGVASATRRIVTENIVLALGVKAAVLLVSILTRPLMWLAVVADVGVALLAVLNSMRTVIRAKRRKPRIPSTLPTDSGRE